MLPARLRSALPLMLGVLVGLGVSSVALHAQAPHVSPTDYLVWNQPAPSPAVAGTYRYTGRVDGGAATVLANVRCQTAVAPATGVDCGVINPAPATGLHSMTLTYAIPLATGGFTGESPALACNWETVGNPSVPPTNPRWLRILNGVFAFFKRLGAGWS